MVFNPKIFKAYDLRGIYPDDLDETTAYDFGRAYAAYIATASAQAGSEKFTVAVGSDVRLSSPALKAKLIAGLTDSGLDVHDFGVVSTPVFYFGVGYFGYAGGIQVSASHNPKEWNGFKAVAAKAMPIAIGSGLLQIKAIMENGEFGKMAASKGSVIAKNGIAEAEAEELLKNCIADGFQPAKLSNLKIVVDPANSTGALDAAALFAHLPCKLIKINFELDGTFPSHPANPMEPENTKDLQAEVVKQKADLGIALDGDADRIFLVDEKGQRVSQAIIRGLLAQLELKKNPGAKIVYDARPGKSTVDMIEQAGGVPVVAPIGRTLIAPAMAKASAVFGGESSGHFFYPHIYGTFEMPMLVILKLLRLISEQDKPFSEIVAPYDVYSHSGEINLKINSRDQAEMIIKLAKSRFSDGKQSYVDGLSVAYPDFWFNLRASNTEPLLRFTLEAKNSRTMEVKRDEILEFLKECS